MAVRPGVGSARRVMPGAPAAAQGWGTTEGRTGMPKVVAVEREVTVVVELQPQDGDEPVRVPGAAMPLLVDRVQILYAGRGYVRVMVHGRQVHPGGRVRGEAAGYWWHQEGRPAADDVRDTAHAPEWIRDLAQRYAPADFTAVS